MRVRIEEDELGDAYIVLPEDIIEDLQIEIGDVLQVEMNDDGSITLIP